MHLNCALKFKTNALYNTSSHPHRGQASGECRLSQKKFFLPGVNVATNPSLHYTSGNIRTLSLHLSALKTLSARRLFENLKSNHARLCLCVTCFSLFFSFF